MSANRFSVGDILMAEARRENGLRSITTMSIEDTGNGDVLCLEGYSGRYFWSSTEAVEWALSKWSYEFAEGNYICFNTLYDLLGITGTHFGYQWGYPPNEDFYDFRKGIDWKTEMIHDTQIDHDLFVIDIYTYPMECWLEI